MWKILYNMVSFSGSPPGCFKALQASWTSSFDKNNRCFHVGLSNASRVLCRIGLALSTDELENTRKLCDVYRWEELLYLLLDASQKVYRSIAIEDERHGAAPEPPNELWSDVLGTFLEEGGVGMLCKHLDPKAFNEDKQVTPKHVDKHLLNMKVAIILKRLVNGIDGSSGLGSISWVKGTFPSKF
jgi:hypothetical protein